MVSISAQSPTTRQVTHAPPDRERQLERAREDAADAKAERTRLLADDEERKAKAKDLARSATSKDVGRVVDQYA